MKRLLLGALLVSCPGEAAPPYVSPYRVDLPYPVEELIPDLLQGERGDLRFEAKVPHGQWYRHANPWIGPWGPLPREYPPPAVAGDGSDDWKRARVLATALRYVGYGYRHHHVPDWDPPPGWYTPKPGGTRHDGQGVDCSSFTSFVYNQALGIGISSDVVKQAATQAATLHGGGDAVPVKVLPRQKDLAGWREALRPGDLVFIRPRSGTGISHVVIWVGAWGVPGDPPLVLDSHGEDVRDSSGVLIPSGIHLRPFRADSWYCTSADHALRIVGY